VYRRFKNSGFLHSGSGNYPGYRLKGSSRIQQTKGEAPVGLPINCYEKSWLQSLTKADYENLQVRMLPLDFTPPKQLEM
jgi:hypothetical protein